MPSKVKPLVPASEQHNGAYSQGDVMADWFAFDMPKGGAAPAVVTLTVQPNFDTTSGDFGGKTS